MPNWTALQANRDARVSRRQAGGLCLPGMGVQRRVRASAPMASWPTVGPELPVHTQQGTPVRRTAQQQEARRRRVLYGYL